MIYRVFSEQDTFITTAKLPRSTTPNTGSNLGHAEIIEVFKETGISGTIGFSASASLARSLVKFDLSEISVLTASSKAPTTGASFFLKLFDAKHGSTIPTSYDIEVSMLSRSWDEGRGIDTQNYADKGFANWDNAISTVAWDLPGGDYLSGSVTSSYHFDYGNENLEVDVTDIVNSWLTGGLPNHGFMIKLTDTEETNSLNYFRKKFHARNTHFKDKRPTLEMRWDDSTKDDRGVFLFDCSSSLYLYNKKRGQLQDITGVGLGNNVIDVAICDLSGNIYTTSGSHTGLTGIYSASIVLPTGSYSGSLFNDKWSFAGKSYMTASFTPHNDNAQSNNTNDQYTVKVINLKKEYELNESVRFNIFVKSKNYNPSVVNTGSLSLKNSIIEKGYYRIDNHTTGEHVIPLGTGSTETTRLSYDENGNYFNFYMSTLAENEVYRIILFFDVDGQLQRIDDKFLFRVV